MNLFSGEPNTPVVFCKKNNLTYQYTSDQYGFNNIKEIYLMKYVDAMLIGDYLIHGDCAINNENLYELLKKKKTIANFAYAGNGPLINYETLENFYFKIPKPKNILWFFNENDDLFDLRHNYILESKIIKKNEKIFDSKDNFLKNILNFLKLLEIRSETFNLILYLPSKEDYSKYEQIIRKAKKFSNKNDSNFVFIYFPSIYNLQSNNPFMNLRFKIIEKKIIALAEKNDLKFINLKSELKKNMSNQVIFSIEKGHLTNIGYQLLSNKIILSIN